MQIIARLIDWLDTAPAAERARAVDALVRAWDGSPLDDEAREMAEAAMTCILDDEEEMVREALSLALSATTNPPRHLAIALASDTPTVSLPMLRHASCLLSGELRRVAETGATEQRLAIACRDFIAPGLSAALVKQSEVEVCLTLLMNPAAEIEETTFYELANTLGNEPTIRRCMLARPDIGMRARTRLIEAYAESLYDAHERELPRRRAEIVRLSEKSIITYAAQIADWEIGELVDALIDRDRLTTAFLLRAICMGNLTLFCHALSRLSGQPIDRVERVLKDQRKYAFHAVYEKAQLPKVAEPVFFAALQAWCLHLSRDEDIDPVKLQYRVAREVLATVESTDPTIENLLVLLRAIVADSAREEAREQINRLQIETARHVCLPGSDGDGEVEEPLDEETVIAFAAHFADELADLALADERELDEAAEALIAANDEAATETHQSDEHAANQNAARRRSDWTAARTVAQMRSLLKATPQAA